MAYPRYDAPPLAYNVYDTIYAPSPVMATSVVAVAVGTDTFPALSLNPLSEEAVLENVAAPVTARVPLNSPLSARSEPREPEFESLPLTAIRKVFAT